MKYYEYICVKNLFLKNLDTASGDLLDLYLKDKLLKKGDLISINNLSIDCINDIYNNAIKICIY
ncbi:hypothetical protein CU308_06625 [Prochlorococcus marinus str. MU1410]|nr:hypothetical protein [Prochlorococcus marinus str. MU1410]